MIKEKIIWVIRIVFNVPVSPIVFINALKSLAMVLKLWNLWRAGSFLDFILVSIIASISIIAAIILPTTIHNNVSIMVRSWKKISETTNTVIAAIMA
jgi:hypothetical protein